MDILPWADEIQARFRKEEDFEPSESDIETWKGELRMLIDRLPGFIVKTLHTQSEKDAVLAKFRDAVDNGNYDEALKIFNETTVLEIESEAKDIGRVLDENFNEIRDLLKKLANSK